MAQYPEDNCGCYLRFQGVLVPEAMWRFYHDWYGDKMQLSAEFVNGMFQAAIQDIQSQLAGDHFPSFWDIPVDVEPEVTPHDYM